MRELAKHCIASSVVVLAIVTHPAQADESSALYRVSWAGMPAGEIRLTLRDEPGAYHDEIQIRSVGLARLVTRFRGSATSDGRFAAERPVPLHYDAAYDLRKLRDRRLSMQFALRGGAVVADRGPADTSRKPPLAEPFRSGVLDPLSVVTAIRDQLRRGNRGSFTVPVYDGARRFDVNVRVQPKRAGDSVLRLDLTLTPIAGFKGGGDEGDPDDAPRPVALTISDDQRLMPLAMTVSLYYLPLVVELRRWCEAAAPCVL
jgi:hypothetical protein